MPRVPNSVRYRRYALNCSKINLFLTEMYIARPLFTLKTVVKKIFFKFNALFVLNELFFVKLYCIINFSTKLNYSEVIIMQVVPFSAFRDNIEQAMDRVCDRHEVLVINRENGRSLVLMSLEDYTNVEKTTYLYGQEKRKTENPLGPLGN
jgi:prevent-host-death family protein